MINLIKNEMIKVFHKKAIYILALVTVFFAVLSGVIVKVASNINNIFSDDTYISLMENNLDTYDLKNPEELNYYVDDKTNIDLAHILKDYEVDSWQHYRIDTYGGDYLHKVNEAKYISKNKEEEKEAQKVFDEFIAEINNHDWQYFVNKDLEDVKVQREETAKELDDQELTEKEKLEITKNLNRLDNIIEGYNYRLKLNIPDDGSDESLLIEQYVSTANQYLDMNKDEDKISDYDELSLKRETEKTYYITKYKLEHNMKGADTFSAANMLLSDTITPILFIIVAIVMIAGTIMADEFNKGTIKQLLLRPYKRWKILLSKYIATILSFGLFLIFYEIVSYIIYGVTLGFSSYSLPVVLYNFNSHEVFTLNLFTSMLINLLSILPAYLIILTLTFFVGVLTTNGAVSIAVGFLSFFFGNIINQMASLFNIKLLAFIPTMCWNFNPYLFGGLPTYKYSSLGISIGVSVVTFLVFFVGSFVVFKHKDIKNQ